MDEKELQNVIELNEDSDYIMEFLSQSRKKVGDIETILTLVITKFLLAARKNFQEDGFSGEKLEVMMAEYKSRIYTLIEKGYIMLGKFCE